MQGFVYEFPEGVAGTAAVGGATHVDCTDAGREGLVFWCRVHGGTVETVDDPAWVRPMIANPDYDPSDPESPEEIPDASAVPDQLFAAFVAIERPAPLAATIRIVDTNAFLTWCAAPVEEGGRGRAIDEDGLVEYVERDILMFGLTQWLTAGE